MGCCSSKETADAGAGSETVVQNAAADADVVAVEAPVAKVDSPATKLARRVIAAALGINQRCSAEDTDEAAARALIAEAEALVADAAKAAELADEEGGSDAKLLAAKAVPAAAAAAASAAAARQRALAARRESLRREARREVNNVDSKILSDIAALANPAASIVQLLSALAVALDAKVDETSTAAGFQGKQRSARAILRPLLLPNALEDAALVLPKGSDGKGLAKLWKAHLHPMLTHVTGEDGLRVSMRRFCDKVADLSDDDLADAEKAAALARALLRGVTDPSRLGGCWASVHAWLGHALSFVANEVLLRAAAEDEKLWRQTSDRTKAESD